jgi:hypothetical protein
MAADCCFQWEREGGGVGVGIFRVRKLRLAYFSFYTPFFLSGFKPFSNIGSSSVTWFQFLKPNRTESVT